MGLAERADRGGVLHISSLENDHFHFQGEIWLGDKHPEGKRKRKQIPQDPPGDYPSAAAGLMSAKPISWRLRDTGIICFWVVYQCGSPCGASLSSWMAGVCAVTGTYGAYHLPHLRALSAVLKPHTYGVVTTGPDAPSAGLSVLPAIVGSSIVGNTEQNGAPATRTGLHAWEMWTGDNRTGNGLQV